ncbi:DUF2339 domain-containing protein [Cohnella endophytica]|uniref:DUF2339 domain-containing protein n=1 Tax=Cohnella endophytica TaxID=2419778 RepID=A0A494YBF1_9BACL|nr:DUF2339 domain-containing protein [Cohnella endophytica]RKP57272.1 DUF2339 domain-containing protein [Cohnella endophytica]
MDVIFRKHWTSLLGVLFILAAFVTLFKYSLDQGWITEGMKIGFGLLSGTGLCVAGLALTNKGIKWLASVQILLGLGACILYATFAFAGIYFRLWSPMIVLIGMTAVTAGVSAYAYRFESRLLMNIALIGGLMSPLMMQPETDQVFTLFLYLLVINSAFFFLSIVRGWSELRIVAFIGTWLIYSVYYVNFDPPTDGLWSMPIRYALAVFIYYLVGFLLSSWKNNRCFDGWNLYLSLANGVLFGCWSIFILQGDLDYSFVLLFIGILYASSGSIIYRLTRKAETASISQLLGGALMLLLASTHLGSGMDSKPLINVFVWGGIAGLLTVVAQIKRIAAASVISVFIWFGVGCYWFAVTWSAPRGEWFGTFIPFLNWGAMSWMLLAWIGFYYSVKGIVSRRVKGSEEQLSNVFALLAHLIVGGLLTVQIQNVFLVYYDSAYDQLLQLSLSVSWGVYALLLFLWGAYRNQNLFRIAGSAVLLLVACKAMIIDLEGEQMLYKVFVLLLLGGISFLITWINGKWKAEPKPKSDPVEELLEVPVRTDA